jgi:retron-type reverse transcriptase
MVFSYERLTRAWLRYRRGKRRVLSVQEFELRRVEELNLLRTELAQGTWRHAPYRQFYICDPKARCITAAAVRDRVVHQVVFEEVERVFEPTFLPCSFSARKGRGVHLALDHVEKAIQRLRRTAVWPVWTLKADVRKFYDSIDHGVLLDLLTRRVVDPSVLRAVQTILGSTHSVRGAGKGIPIGNITSQVFANVYLHELDRHAIHTLRLPSYFRYADDVFLLGRSQAEVETAAAQLRAFARDALALDLLSRPARVLSRGADFLGSVLWPYGRTVRPQTRTRIVRHIRLRIHATVGGQVTMRSLHQTLASYGGIVKRVRDRGLRELVATKPTPL